MAVTDPIADMLTRIRNAHHALHAELTLPKSKNKEAMASILKDQGYIDGFSVSDSDINIRLRYHKGKPVIQGLKRVSRPGLRVYVGSKDIPRVQNGLGICIVSTSQGILDGEEAQKRNVGGELMCEVW